MSASKNGGSNGRRTSSLCLSPVPGPNHRNDHNGVALKSDKFRYLDELVSELRMLNCVQVDEPGSLRHSALLLSSEIDSVWKDIASISQSPNRSEPNNAKNTSPMEFDRRENRRNPLTNSLMTPPVSASRVPRLERGGIAPFAPTLASPTLLKMLLNHLQSPLNVLDSPNFSSPTPSPMSSEQATKSTRSPQSIISLSTPVHLDTAKLLKGCVETKTEDGEFQLQQKIPIPSTNNVRCNFIGRILGPRGISVKQLEAETECSILIRGEGSVKDAEREAHLRGLPGWEHLIESLHVLVTATAKDKMGARKKLEMGVGAVQRLLATPADDEYKKKQLEQLAIINGTYRPNNDSQPRSS